MIIQGHSFAFFVSHLLRGSYMRLAETKKKNDKDIKHTDRASGIPLCWGWGGFGPFLFVVLADFRFWGSKISVSGRGAPPAFSG